jgi:hypothetical protein
MKKNLQLKNSKVTKKKGRKYNVINKKQYNNY